MVHQIFRRTVVVVLSSLVRRRRLQLKTRVPSMVLVFEEKGNCIFVRKNQINMSLELGLY